jgi:1-acyl-sn-glycerol-3-phosphate acyltransferase
VIEPSHARAEVRSCSREELNLLTLELIRTLQATYEPGRDRVITKDNVYQPARDTGRDALEAFMDHLLLPGSRVEGLEHLDTCLADLDAGRHVLFLAEHRGNLDVPTFHNLMRRAHPRYGPLLGRLIYIAGRKLNESSDLIKMFSEKYARLVIVPRRDIPPERPGADVAGRAQREAVLEQARQINRAAFRELVRLKKAGHVFVLFPLGGRLKPDADNRPVKETTSYLNSFDRAYLLSMEGNTLPPLPRMEDERPIQERVVFRVGPPLDCKTFLGGRKAAYEAEQGAGRLPEGTDYEQHTVQHLMTMLENLRVYGRYEGPPAP